MAAKKRELPVPDPVGLLGRPECENPFGADQGCTLDPSSEFTLLLAQVKERIQSAQTRAILAVNSELVHLYWDIGRLIAERQQHEGWGAAVIPRLAAEIRNELPETKGFSARNINRMLAFYREYASMGPGPAVSPQLAAKMDGATKLPQPAAKLDDALFWSVPWFHHIVLMEQVKDLPTRRWYMEQTFTNGWSRNVLSLQVSARAHARHARAVSNFAATLPAPQSDLVQQTLKDPYLFDILTLTDPFHDRDLETGLFAHLD